MIVRLVGNAPDEPLVAWGVCLPFTVAPDVVVWGTRFFRWIRTETDGVVVYAEAFAAAVFPNYGALDERPTDERAKQIMLTYTHEGGGNGEPVVPVELEFPEEAPTADPEP